MLKIKRNISIRDQVLEQIRNLILTNQLNPGERLFEEKLASEMGISRTPVREALHVIEREGFLEAIPRVGYIVKKPRIEDFEEIIEIRKVLETLTATWAMDRLSSSVLKDLEDNIEKSNDAIRRDNMKRFANLNEKFHEIIDNASGGKRVCEINRNLRNYMFCYGIGMLLNKENAQLSLNGHKQIVEALMSKNEKEIRKVIYMHIDEAKEAALAHFF